MWSYFWKNEGYGDAAQRRGWGLVYCTFTMMTLNDRAGLGWHIPAPIFLCSRVPSNFQTNSINSTTYSLQPTLQQMPMLTVSQSEHDSWNWQVAHFLHNICMKPAAQIQCHFPHDDAFLSCNLHFVRRSLQNQRRKCSVPKADVAKQFPGIWESWSLNSSPESWES